MIENNKLIAEFMDVSVYPIEGTPEFKRWEGKRCDNHIDQLQYHNSWDWLMPVVKRISEEIPCGEVEELHDFYDLFHYGLYEANINKVYSSVLQFIQWYNTQNTTK